jgi:hypothetical protein
MQIDYFYKAKENEKMKTNVCKIMALMLIFVIAASLCSCKDESQRMTVVIGGDSPTEYSVYLNELDTSRGLVAVLDDLKKNVKLNYEIKGGKLVRVGGLEYNTGDGTDICVYTSVAADASDAEDRFTVDYKGATYSEIDVKLSEMTLEPGALIYIGLLRYE